jgi:excisionase family DNA binding protein
MAKRQTRKAGHMYDPNVLLQKTKLRIEEAAELLEVSPRQVRRYLDDEKLTPAYTPGGQRRVRNDDKLKGYL